LTADKKLEIFKDYMKETFNKRKQEFRELLDENRSLINPFSEYDSVLEMLKDDPRFLDFPERSRR